MRFATHPRGRTITRAAATMLAGTAVLLATAPSATARQECAGAGDVPSAQTLAAAAVAVACLVNAERARTGRHDLHGDRNLRRAARRHSRDMVRRAFFAHVNPSGGTLTDRLRRSGYLRGSGASQFGETLGWGAGSRATPGAIVAAWINSPPHYRILLGRQFREVGVGVAAGAPLDIGGPGAATYTLDVGMIGP